MKSLPNKLLLLVIGILLVPVIPFVAMGSWFEPWLEKLFGSERFDASPVAAFTAVVGILAVDIALPVPSSAICTFAGKQLGAVLGTASCWLGLNISAGLGYWIGNRFGRPIAARMSDPETLDRLEAIDNRSSILCLIICRALPIVAEASVLLMGIKKLPRRLFWPPVAVSNICIATALCWLGAFSAKANWFPVAVCISIAIPVSFALYWKLRK